MNGWWQWQPVPDASMILAKNHQQRTNINPYIGILLEHDLDELSNSNC